MATLLVFDLRCCFQIAREANAEKLSSNGYLVQNMVYRYIISICILINIFCDIFHS